MANTVKKPAQAKSGKPTLKPKEETDTIHVRLPMTTIQLLDKLAAENSTYRNAIVQIAIARLVKTGL